MNPEASRSALRGLEVFEAFKNAGRPLSLSEAARLTDMPISTCHGVFKALEQRGYLYFIAGRDAYPTRRLWDLAQNINEHDPVVQRLEPALLKLRDEADETIILGARNGAAVLYLLVLESSQPIRYSSAAGERKPLHSSGIGKVMLGAMSPDELDAWLAPSALKKVTDRTIVSGARLKADLAESRTRGYYVTHGENVSDVMAVAAPLKMGGSTFGVAIAGPLQRMAAKEAALAKKLTRSLKSIEAATTPA
jgi:IclR family transcriptional regulator, acetate operon repressor